MLTGVQVVCPVRAAKVPGAHSSHSVPHAIENDARPTAHFLQSLGLCAPAKSWKVPDGHDWHAYDCALPRFWLNVPASHLTHEVALRSFW